jgi:Tol biopolymer transport system component
MLKVQLFQNHKTLVVGVLLSFLITSCSPAISQTPQSLTSTILPSNSTQTIQPENSTLTATGLPIQNIPPVLGTSTPAAPAANRQKPEDWRDWPVIPVPSARARQIYQQGIAAGTDPTRFSKVGDCQAIQEVLLGRYEKPTGYVLRGNPNGLAETIKQFAGSFGRDGEAVQGGFNAASELSPLWSNPDTCDPGETPLECELRIHNPSIILISLEVWWDGRSPDIYEKNMRQIIDLAISKGILPILSTKADNVEGDNSINLANARLAYEYDLPLWNWWKAAQALPNHGLDPDRPDGFHISLDSWDERSFTALQSIDSVWRGVTSDQTNVLNTPAASVPEPINPPSTPVSTIPQAPTPTTEEAANSSVPALTPPSDSAFLSNPVGIVLLSAARRNGETVTPQGVFVVNPSTGATVQILPVGTTLQAVSPDGRQILYSRNADLFLAKLDGSQQSQISTRFVDHGATAARWQADGRSILFLTEEDGKTLLVQYPMDGSTTWKRLSPTSVNPVEIYPASDPNVIYWENGDCPPSDACTRNTVYASGLDGSSAEYLSSAYKAAFSSDKHWMAYEERTSDGKSQLSLATMDLKTRRKLKNIGDDLLDYSWSPDGTKLSLLTLDRSDYSGKWIGIHNMVFTPKDFGTKILPTASGINTRAVWSPDGGSLLLTGTSETTGGYAIKIQMMDILTGKAQDLSSATGFNASDFIYTTRIHWTKPVQ